MIEIIEKAITPERQVVLMGDMKPGQIGTINSSAAFDGVVVMRTLSEVYFEVMNLSNPGPGRCWTSFVGYNPKVLLFNKPVYLKITNDK